MRSHLLIFFSLRAREFPATGREFVRNSFHGFPYSETLSLARARALSRLCRANKCQSTCQCGAPSESVAETVLKSVQERVLKNARLMPKLFYLLAGLPTAMSLYCSNRNAQREEEGG